DAGVAHDRVLHVIGIDVEPGDQNHVLLAVDQLEEAVLVDHTDVAGLQPAVRGQHFRGVLGTLPVAEHDLWAADPQLTGLAGGQLVAVVINDLHLGVYYRLTDEAFLIGRVRGGGDHHRRGLGHAEAFTDHSTGALEPALGDSHVQRRAAGVDPFQVTEIQAVEFGVRHQRHEQGVDAGQQGDPMPLHVGNHAVQVAGIGDQHAVEAGKDRGQAVRGKGEDMVQRQRRHPRFVAVLDFTRLDDADRLQDVAQQVAVGEHRALGDAGGAAGVLQYGDIIQTTLGFDLREGSTDGQGLHETAHVGGVALLLGVAPVIHAGDDQMLDLRVRLDVTDRRNQLVKYHHGTGTGVAELVAGLGSGVLGIGIVDDQSGLERTEDGDHVLQQVG